MRFTFSLKVISLCTILAALLVMNISMVAQKHQAATHFEESYVCSMLREPIGEHIPQKGEGQGEINYRNSLLKMQEMWCSSTNHSPEEKLQAADAMAVAWKGLWDQENPWNASFHESGAFDLLILMGLTHQVPKPLKDDKEFLKLWIHECEASCFTISYSSADEKNPKGLLQPLRLRSETLHALEDSDNPDEATRAVVDLLMSATYEWVD